jgi:small-conductance mechanosensitive channel
MANNKRFWTGLSMIAVVVLAALILVNYFLGQFTQLNDLIQLITRIITLIALLFAIIYAYEWVSSQSGKDRTIWFIIYAISVIVIAVFYLLGWFNRS